LLKSGFDLPQTSPELFRKTMLVVQEFRVIDIRMLAAGDGSLDD